MGGTLAAPSPSKCLSVPAHPHLPHTLPPIPPPLKLLVKRHQVPTMPFKQQVLPKYILILQSNPPR